jgi:hypothetical protein
MGAIKRIIEDIVEKHYPIAKSNDSKTFDRRCSLKLLLEMHLKPIKQSGSLPLDPDHMCFKDGHSMQRVFQVDKQYMSLGKNACSRCGEPEYWQFPDDFKK